MYTLETIKSQLAEKINKNLAKKILSSSSFVVPPDSALADISLPCFLLAKEMKESPVEVANKIVKAIENEKVIAKVVVAGPYVNISLSQTVIGEVIREISKAKGTYGNNTIGKKKRVMQEYANGNTHKEYHVGHLRNIAFGDAVNRLLAANGYTSIPVSYINDFGIHVAKTLWYYLKTKPQEPKGNKGYFLGQLYAEATARMGDDPQAKSEVGHIMKAIESRTGGTYKLWKKTRQWSLDQMKEVNKELGVKFVTTFYESDYIEQGLKMVEVLKKKGILIASQGAIIADLEKYNLGVLVVIRSDGTALYPVADFALTTYKVKKYKLDTSLWVVDIRQGQYLHQMFKVLELAGLKAHLAHLPYEFVKSPSGMMSSRTGNIIPYEDLKQAALKRTEEEVRKRHSDWSEKKIIEVSRVLAFGALKFEMVKVSGEKVITFDMETALRFDGYTSAYLQYTYARIKSMVRKVTPTVKKAKVDYRLLTEGKEKKLAVMLAHFPEVVVIAGKMYQPSEIARYLHELGQLFNDFYHSVPILNDTSLAPALAKARLELAEATSLVINRGLHLLGIETVEEM